MFKQGHPRHLVLATVVLTCGSLFAQHYQGRDHTVFHPPASPPAKHSSNLASANASSARAADATRHHDVKFSSPSVSHTAQPTQLSPRPK